MIDLKPTNRDDGWPSYEEWKEQHKGELASLSLNEDEMRELYGDEYDGYCYCLEE
jgi:hypothetical protein